MKTNRKKELGFELNLLPVFDIMSVCICFLLMTVAWIQLGSLNVKQAMGSQSQSETDNAPAVWAYFERNGDVTLTLKNVAAPAVLRNIILRGARGAVNWNSVDTQVDIIKRRVPQVKTALIMPSKTSPYQDIIHLMDDFKRSGIGDVGIAPL